jgi:hypothetical protein
MTKAYQDKATGKWKYGTRGQPIYDSKQQAERAGIDLLTERLRYIRDRLNTEMINYGR